MQLKRHSILESLINVAIGYSIAVLSQILIFPLFDIHVGLKTNLGIGLWFTAISIIRSYCIRRVFNRWSESPEKVWKKYEMHIDIGEKGGDRHCNIIYKGTDHQRDCLFDIIEQTHGEYLNYKPTEKPTEKGKDV